MEAGADAIELDVRRTRDGILVVHHDASLGTSRGGVADGTPLAACTLEDVRSHARIRGVAIPTLEEAVDCCASRIALDVELKEAGYEEEALALVLRKFDVENVVFTSFHDGVVSAFKRTSGGAGQVAGIVAGLLIGRRRAWPIPSGVHDRLLAARLRRCGADLVAAHASVARAPFLQRMAAAGWPSLVWTVDDPSAAMSLAREGAHAIITNDPGGIREALARSEENDHEPR
jgi:glycerophosphoryl diester phosphodiesterase